MHKDEIFKTKRKKRNSEIDRNDIRNSNIDKKMYIVAKEKRQRRTKTRGEEGAGQRRGQSSSSPGSRTEAWDNVCECGGLLAGRRLTG